MFIVRVADNFHYMDEEQTDTHSEHLTWVEAVGAAAPARGQEFDRTFPAWHKRREPVRLVHRIRGRPVHRLAAGR